MRNFKLATCLVIVLLALAACGGGSSGSEVIYETVSETALSPGDSIPAPTDEAILTVSGKINQTNVQDTAQFDLETLESLGQVEYDVNDPFAKEERVFTGVLLSQLLDVVEVAPDATTLELIALNEYSAEMDIGDAEKWPVLFALQADGQYIPLDDGGPAIIVFPFDDYPEIDHPTYDSLWVWSMTEIVAK